MNYQIVYRVGVEKDFDAIPDPFQTLIRKRIGLLADNPRPQGFKKLAGMGNTYRIRVGQYRVGYQIVDRQLIVTVVAVAERGRVYQVMKRRLGL